MQRLSGRVLQPVPCVPRSLTRPLFLDRLDLQFAAKIEEKNSELLALKSTTANTVLTLTNLKVGGVAHVVAVNLASALVSAAMLLSLYDTPALTCSGNNMSCHASTNCRLPPRKCRH